MRRATSDHTKAYEDLAQTSAHKSSAPRRIRISTWPWPKR